MIALDRGRPGAAASSSRLPAEARSAAAMDFGRRDATARAAPGRQARGRGVEPGRPSGRQSQARRRIAGRRGGGRREHPRTHAGQGNLDHGAARRRRRAGRWNASSRPMWWCWRPAPGRAASRGLAPEPRPPVRPIKGQMLALRMDPAAPLINHVSVGAGRLSGAAPRRPADRRRHRGGEGIRYHADRRRPADAAGGGLAGGAGYRGIADRGNVGRPPAGQPRRCAYPRAGPARRTHLRHRPSSQRHPARAGDG